MNPRPHRSNARIRPWALSCGVIVGATLLLSLAATDTRTRPLLLNTLILGGVSSLLSVPLGAALAILVQRTHLPGRRLMIGALTCLIFIPPYLQVAGWEACIGMQGWFCRYWFPDQAVALLAGWRGALWIQTLANTPWVALIVAAGLAAIPSELEEQASLYGRPFDVLRRVTIPLLMPALLCSGLVVFVFAVNEVTITDVYQIRTFAEEIYTGFALGDELWDVPSRTLPGILLTSGFACAALLASRQLTRHLNTVRRLEARSVYHGRGIQISWYLLCCLLLLVFAVPVVSLVYQAGLQVEMLDGDRLRRWSATKTIKMLAASPSHFRHEYAWSFLLAQLVSITVMVVGCLLAWMSKRFRVVQAASWCGVVFGLAVPGPLLALLLGKALNQPNSDLLFYFYDRTLLLPWLTLTIRLFPFGYWMADLAVRRMSPRPWELARVSGAGWADLIRLVLWPSVGPTLIWLWVILVALAVADLSATILAVPPGVTTVAIRIFNFVHYGVADQLAALCLGTLAIFGGLALLVLSLRPATVEQSSRKV